MRQKLSLVLLLVVTTIFNKINGQCQNIVNIPNANFKAALVAHGRSITGVGVGIIDTNNDGEICESEAKNYQGAIKLLKHGNAPHISSLEGIENFIKLRRLTCVGHNLTSLDLSRNNQLKTLHFSHSSLSFLDLTQNTSLIKLYLYRTHISNLDLTKNTALVELLCYENNLSSLDVSKNTMLKELNCYSSNLSSLDVSKNTMLEVLNCYKNDLTSLDLTQNTALKKLQCHENNLSSLKINNGNNTNMIDLDASDNPNLTCIQVDANIIGAIPSNWSKDAGASYSVNCSLGIDDIELNSQEVSIYPNPVLDILHVSLKHSDVKSVTVYNVLGAVVLQSTETSIGVQALPSGVYIVKVEDVKGRKFASKVVKK